MKRWQVALLIIGIFVGGASEARAQAAGAFARVGMGARGISMSNALVADGSGSASPYYNPALAPFIEGQHLSLSAGLLSFDRELQFVQLATPLEPSAGIAAGLIHAGVSGIDGRDASGYHTRELSTDEYSFFLSFGTRLLNRFTLGAGLQIFRADYQEDLDPVTTIGVDVGATARVTEALRLGLTVDDLLARYSWDSAGQGTSVSDYFPRRLRIGAAYALMGERMQLVAEYESRFTSLERRSTRFVLRGARPVTIEEGERLMMHESRFRAGAEMQFVEAFTVRAGVDRVGAGALRELTPSAGFAVEQPVGELRLRGAYAFQLAPYAVGTMHFLTLQLYL